MSGLAPAPQRIIPPLGDQPLTTPDGQATQPMIQWMQRLSAFVGPVNVTTGSGSSTTNLSISEQITNLTTEVNQLLAQASADFSTRARLSSIEQSLLSLRSIVNQQASQPGLAYHQPQTQPPGPGPFVPPPAPPPGPGLAFTAPSTGIAYLANGARLLDGYGAPNTLVYGWTGDTYLQRDGSSSGVLWVKASGDNTNTGWIAPLPGTVTEVDTGTGLTGGPITGTGTVSFAAITNLDVLANISGGSAAPVPNTVTAVIDAAIGSTQGNILYRGASTWSVLAPGTTGQFLQTQGASANPAWNTVADVGRNKIINGLFRVQQRGAGAFTTAGYTADQWTAGLVTDTISITVAVLADADRAAIGDEEAQFALQNVFVGNSAATAFNDVQQRIENVLRLANTTVTISFWAKAASGTPKLGANINQNFGSGGSTTVAVAGVASTLSTTWTRYSVTQVIPSASGKTIGAGNFTGLQFWYSSGSNNNSTSGGVGVQSATISIWGVQVEFGNLTPLEKPNLRQELANCQRYYTIGFTHTDASATGAAAVYGSNLGFPVTMRIAPTVANTFSTTTNCTGSTGTPQISGFATFATATAGGQMVLISSYTASAEL